jgi:hypothetical protein
MIKITANDPKEQDLANYLEAISQPYVAAVTQANFDSMLDGRIRAIEIVETQNGLEYNIIFPME